MKSATILHKYRLNKNAVLKKIAITLGMFVVFYFVFNAKLFSFISPFAYALLFALVFSGYNPLWFSIIYLLAGSLYSLEQTHLFSMIAVFLVVNFILPLHKKSGKNKDIKFVYLLIYAIISQVPNLYFTIESAPLPVLFAFFLSLVFLYCATVFFASTINRGYKTLINLDELLCGSLMLIVVSMGCANIVFYGIEVIKVVATFVVLVACFTLPASTTIILGVLMGCGPAIVSTNPIFIAVFVCYALGAVAFKTNYKLLSIVAILLVEIVFGLYFDAHNYFEVMSVASVAIGAAVFLIFPLKQMKSFVESSGINQDKVAIRNIVNRSKEGVCRRMKDIAGVFGEMDFVFRQMIKGTLSLSDAKSTVLDELVGSVCSSCSEKNSCLRVNGEQTTEVLDSLVSAAFEKDRATLLDVSQYLSSRCIKLNYLISVTNQLVEKYKNYVSMVSNMDASKILIANQLKGVSQILLNLAQEVKLNISFDATLESRVREELAYYNINCLETVVYEQNVCEKNVTLLVRNETLIKNTIEKILTKIVGKKMGITNIVPSELPNVSVVTLKNASNFDIVFGSATSAKIKNNNGDSHSLIKIDNGKYMVAVCDGMGSGASARRTSELAISLLENFYKAGFDNNIILSSVNKLLSLNGDENFSTLDLCVLDLRQNICDFIKLGSPPSYIKHKNNTEEIEGVGLPIGAVDDINPTIVKKFLYDFDTIVLLTDGISDAFGSSEELQVFVNNLTDINPQTMADIILKQAIDLRGANADDMTVFVIRVFPLK